MAIQIIREISADFIKRGSTRVIYAKQNDCNSRFLNVRIQSDGQEFYVEPDTKVVINVERPDKAENMFYGTVNTDGTVQVPLTAWMLELAGIISCDISLIYEGDPVVKLTTMQFYVNVEAAVVSDPSYGDDTELSVIVELFEKAKESYEEAAGFAERAEAAAIAAENASPTAVVERDLTGATLVVTDKNGRYTAKINDGKSAYDYAKLGGYPGTEKEFYTLLANVKAPASLETCVKLDMSDITEEVLDFDYFILVSKDSSRTILLTDVQRNALVSTVRAHSIYVDELEPGDYFATILLFAKDGFNRYYAEIKSKWGDASDWTVESTDYEIYGYKYKDVNVLGLTETDVNNIITARLAEISIAEEGAY